MSPPLQRARKAALAIGGLLAFLLGFSWLALPGILQTQAQNIVAEKSGHRLTLGKPEINPLALSLRIKDLKLDDPEGAPLLAFRELFVDLSAASLTTRGVVIEQLQLDGLAASAILRDDVQRPHNWSRLLAAFAGKEEKTSGAPPKVEIRHLHLRGAQADIADQRTAPPFASRVEAFDLELRDLSTRPDDSGQFHLTAKTAFGAELEWKGMASLVPLASTGQLSLRGVDLGKLAPLLAPRLPPQLGFTPPEGIAGLALDYRLGHADGKLALTLDPLALEFKDLVLRKPRAAGAPALAVKALALQGARFDLASNQLSFQSLTVTDASLESGNGKQRARMVALPEISVAPARIDLAAHVAEVGAISLKNGRIALRRDAAGGIDLVATLQALAPAATPTPSARPASAADATPPAAPWRYAIERAALSGFSLAVNDDTMTPALQLGIDEFSIETSGVSEKLGQPLPLKASLRVASGGKLALEGKLVPATAAIDLQLRLDGLSLKPAQPLIGRHAALDLADGRISAAGRVQHDAGSSAYRGSFAVDALRLNEAGTDKVFLAWKSLGTRQLEVSPQKLQIGELLLDGLDTQLLIAKDGSTNFKSILRQADAPPKAEGTPAAVPPAPTPAAVPAPAPAPAPVADADKAARPGPSFQLSIDRLRFREGELDFADESLIFPFGTRIHKLRGSIAGLSSRPGAAGQLELDGQVDDYGMARAVGQIDPFDPTGFTEIKLVFRNLEMTRLTPYSATFAGRRIDSGKLSLDLDYNIRKRQLQSHNQVVIDKLVLGERVQSPTAKDLPLDLAIALLEDSDGRIDLGLPITGSLDDPQFSYGAIVWKVITNVLGKIVTAPFRALGALFGGGDEKLESIAFEAGARRLTPPEREKLVKLAAALNKRPALALGVSGTWNEADRVALQDLQLRRTLLEKSGQKIDPQGDPGPISTRTPAIQAALETLFGERFGKAELDGLKQGFRMANPGQLEENLGGKMMSRLTGLVRPPRQLSESEVGALKGTDFHAVLFQRLREKETIADERLQQLALARGESVLAVLKEAKAPVERIQLGTPEKLTGSEHEVALKLGLGKAAR